MDEASVEWLREGGLQQLVEELLRRAAAPDGLATLDLPRLLDEDGVLGRAKLGEAFEMISEGATMADFLSIEREELEMVYTFGRSLFAAGDIERAHRLFQFLCMHSHLNGRYWLAFGTAQARLGRHARALDSFAMGAAVTRGDPRFPIASAEAHLHLDHPDEARSGAEWALALARGTAFESDVSMRAERVLAALSADTATGEPR